jgi:AraC-like DNA-binding protein
VEALDHIARGGTIGLLAALSIVLLRDARRMPSASAAVGFFAGVAAYLMLSSPDYSAEVAPGLDVVLRAAAFAGPAAFWLFTRTLFDDEAALTARDAVVVSLLIAIGFTRTVPATERLGTVLYYSGSGCLVAFALGQVVRGGPADLVEPRRRWRTVFTGVVGLEILIVLGAELLLGGARAPRLLEAIKSLAALWLTMLFTVWVLRPRSELLASEASPSARPSAGASNNAAAEDTRYRERLLARIRDEKIYRQESLTIALLARQLELPEYRLRRIINQQLGYKNFNAFLNAIRIEEACRVLRDPTQERLPILNLALDLGYGSLGPFNRAFRAKTGQTPTEYRRASLRSPSSIA